MMLAFLQVGQGFQEQSRIEHPLGSLRNRAMSQHQVVLVIVTVWRGRSSVLVGLIPAWPPEPAKIDEFFDKRS